MSNAAKTIILFLLLILTGYLLLDEASGEYIEETPTVTSSTTPRASTSTRPRQH